MRRFFLTQIVPINGQVNFQIVLDPSSWIFDHRKIEWEDYITQAVRVEDVLESKREERAGAAMPRMIDTGVKYEKERWLTDSFVIPVSPFIKNAEPKSEATTVRLIKETGEETSIPLSVFEKGVFGFSQNGKILQKDGPLHFYDLENYKKQPITGISEISVE